MVCPERASENNHCREKLIKIRGKNHWTEVRIKIAGPLQIIEVTVSPQGESTIQTKGYSGDACLNASRFLEQALGIASSERKTAEFYGSTSVEQHVQN
jgi:hypothetical protein